MTAQGQECCDRASSGHLQAESCGRAKISGQRGSDSWSLHRQRQGTALFWGLPIAPREMEPTPSHCGVGAQFGGGGHGKLLSAEFASRQLIPALQCACGLAMIPGRALPLSCVPLHRSCPPPPVSVPPSAKAGRLVSPGREAGCAAGPAPWLRLGSL